MIRKLGKRLLPLFLAVTVIISAIPVQAFVSEINQRDKEKIESLFGIDEANPLWHTLVEMNEVLVRYLGSNTLTEDEITDAVINMDWDTMQNARSDIEALEDLINELSNEEKEALYDTNTAKSLDVFYSTLELATTPSFFASSANTVLNGKILISDSQGTGSVSGNKATITVKSGLFSSKSNTIDIYNNTDTIATLSFDYSASNYASFSENSANGRYSVLLYPDGNVTLSIEAAAGNKTATLVLSNFSFVEAAESSNVTFAYESAFGNVTVNGEAVQANGTKVVTLAEGATLVATPKSGSSFLGWIDPSNNYILSTSTSYKLTPVADTTVKAVFTGKSANAYFKVIGGNYLFDDLNNAANYASSVSNKTIVLMNDGTLPAGNYTIPSGVTLLVPFDSANTVYTTVPEVVYETRTTPTAYRTLNMANGANITVNGTICLPAKHYAAYGSRQNGGSTDGPCGFIKMQSGSSITLNNGSALYAYGFITGSGSITAKSGASVYEYFQIMDFRGGSQTTDMENGVFPFSQYYVQNIEVPLTLEAGSVESCYTTMRISNMNLGSAVAFIAKSGAMFNLSSGSVTKRYDPTTDRLVVDVNGAMAISPIELEVGTGLISKKINSKNYELPINGNITVNINSGSITLSQDVAMLPGSEIIIGENAKCVIGSGTNIYLYDSAEWGNFCGPGNKTFIPVQYAPGRKYNRTAADIKDAAIKVEGTLDASAGYVYTTSSGANIYSDGSGEALIKKGSQTKTYQLVQNSGYTEIPITAAKLKNADGTYKTSASSSSTNYYINGTWVEHTGHIYSEKVISVADCVNAGSKVFTCPCGSSYTEVIPAKGHIAGAEATCTTAQVCLTCGDVLVKALGHNYHSVITKPTCTDKGYTTHTCSNCGDIYTDNEVAAKGHIAGAEATCTANQTCTVCGTELKAAIGHDYDVTVIAPTCTEKGYTKYTCLNCGDSYTENEVAAKGHTPGAEATCTEPQKCTECGEVLKSENGHVPGAEATCTQAQICTVCDEELVAALGHSMIYEDAKDSTCTEEGFSSGSHCERCDYTEGKSVIPAKGHTPGAEATCTANQTCTVCGEVLVEAVGHNYEVTVIMPTCTEKGFTMHKCPHCGDSYTDGDVAAKGHTAGAEATCITAQICTDCGAEIAPVKGHTPGAEATCTEAQTCADCGVEIAPAKGHTPGAKATCKNAQICTVCNEELVAAREHKFVKDVTEATCTQDGITVYTCSRCRYRYIESEASATGHNMAPATCTEPSKCLNGGCNHTEGAALGHTEVADEGMPAFCTQDGYTDGSHCSVCGTVIVEQQVIPQLGHNIEQHAAKAPTYTSVGWEAYEDCTRCAYTTYVEIPKLDDPAITDYESFVENLALLEELAFSYAGEVPGKDPLELVIKYIRTGVDRYNEGSWGIMAGYEDAGFAEYVAKIEDEYNSIEGNDVLISVSGLKNIENFILPNGDLVDFGHMFGTMDITYHNKDSINHADVGGWAGDLVDLIEFSDYGGVNSVELEAMISEIGTNYLLQDDPEEVGGFNQQDMYGDLDSFRLMQMLASIEYEQGVLTELFSGYFTEELTMETRADYFLKNRLGGVSTRADVRNAVYNTYTGNKLISTLEGTKDFNTDDITKLRKASCYAFADYICSLAGDYVEVTENPYFTVFSSETSTLAPGVIQNIRHATSADNKQMVYYTATADLSRDDVHVYANYKDNDPSKWGMQTVLAQATAAQNKYGNPESEHYIENYNVIASINGDGFTMATGEPGGLLVMDGKVYHGIDKDGFFGILDDGTAVIGTMDEYNSVYKDRVKEGIGGFGSTLIKDGEISITATTNYYTSRASRTAVGITRTGKVVFMVLDGRQEPVSCGGSMIEIAQIMFDAGCVQAINLDGGGSTTYVAKVEGEDELSVVNKPSDGVQRSVSTSLMIVSTAPSSTAFDHAVIESETDYLTKGASVQLVASGVSATGNSAELPEGTAWAVSDEKWGTVTEDGLFTGLRNGSVDVYLMLDDEIIGTKTMNIVNPDRVYFSKTNINATYGVGTELPVVALYENKPVAIQASDIVFTVSNPSAGSVDGFVFTGTEGSGVKNVTVTAALAVNEEKTATINIALFNMGEISFDFENAIGGDRILAWDRKVSNSTTEDNVTYEIVNPDEPMVTSYTFAIDMTQIPVPERLADLTTMLPGAELEGASAWTFLLQLAERVSVLTEVKPTIHVDKNFDVDYSELTVVNDYFELNGTEFDEETNTLTLTLNWKDQTQAIDPDMANPLCLLNGIKLTPKEGAEWPKDRLSAVNSGEISYNVYMRATALYSFSQKAENQQIYGLYPFINPNDENEKGGYFGDVYAQFEDSYTLSKAVKDGWVNEDGGFAYYADGVRYTGVKLIDGYYYDFGENGINIGQTVYTGIFYDEADGVYRYSKLGVLASGWQMIGTDWHYFDSSTMAAVSGTFEYTGEITYELDETGKVVKGHWAKTLYGSRYYYGPAYYWKGWQTIDGKEYFFDKSYRLENGYELIIENKVFNWYYFDENGVCDRTAVIPDGFYTDRNGYGYSQNGKGLEGLHLIDGVYYCFDYMGYAKTGNHAGRLFGDDYKAVTGIIEKDGERYYYNNGRTGTYGLTEYNGDYYFVYWGGVIKTGKYYVNTTNCDLPVGEYLFGEDGKLVTGFVEENGQSFYYYNGKLCTNALIESNGDYYYINAEGKVKTGKQYVTVSYCDLPAGRDYEFGADGKILDGIVEKDGILYYYENGKTGAIGLTEYNGDYYYVYWNGVIKTGKQYVEKTLCDIPAGKEYEFGADGKMLRGIIEIDGTLYYYDNGRTGSYGLTEYNGDYYYVYWGGVVRTGKQYVGKTLCDLPAEKEYEFGADGKMLRGIIEIDGTLYFYNNGRTGTYGLTEYNGDYYYVYWGGVVRTGKQYVGKTLCDLPAGKEYEFGADGKMLRGIIEKDGVLYYYVNGRTGAYGLTEYNSDYYYVYWEGVIRTGKQYVEKTLCDIPAGKEYEFGADGKMLNGFVTKEDGLYYYQNGRATDLGLIYIDGYYYFIRGGGQVVTNQTYYVWKTNGLSIKMEYTFDEYGRAII